MQLDGNLTGGISSLDQPADAAQLKKYLRALQRRWPVVVGAVFVGMLLGWLTTPGATVNKPISAGRFYRATHTLIADQPSGGASSNQSSSNGGSNLARAAFFVSTGDVPVRVSERLAIPVEEVTSSVSGTALSGVDGLAITAIANDADLAVDLSNTTAEELVKALNDSANQRYNQNRDDVLKRLDALKASRTDLENQLRQQGGKNELLSAQLDSVVNQYRLTYEQFQQLASQPLPGANLRTIETATPVDINNNEFVAARNRNLAGPEGDASQSTTTTVAGKSSSSSASSSSASPPAGPLLRAAMGGALGLLVSLGLVFLLDKYDTRLRRREDVETATILPVITEIPPLSRSQQHGTETTSFSSPRSRTAEAFRVVRTSLLFAEDTRQEGEPDHDRGDERSRVIMVTSPSPSEGKTTSVANLSAVMAEGGMSVLVLNCDFRRPRIGNYLTLDDDPDSTEGQAVPIPGVPNIRQTKVPHVSLITGLGERDASTNPLEVVALQQEVVRWARSRFDVVLLDTAPFLTTNDASELLPETDVVLVVVRSGKTKRASASRTAELMRRLEANVLGIIFNGSNDSPISDYYYHYYLDSKGKRRALTPGQAAQLGAPDEGAGANGSKVGDRREPAPDLVNPVGPTE